MHLSASAAGWIALGAAAAATIALVAGLVHSLTLRRVRKAQLVLLGGGKSDLQVPKPRAASDAAHNH